MTKKNNFGVADCISANVEINFTGEANTNNFAIELVDETIHLGISNFQVDQLNEFIALMLHVQHRVNALKKSFDLE